jgi:hypothetical protein
LAPRGASPLEITLRAGRHAGDVRGPSVFDSIDAYLARILSQEERQSAEATGLAWLQGRSGALPERLLPRGVPAGDLVDAGILCRRVGGSYSFNQPAIGAYLGARGMVAGGPPEEVVQGGWPPAEASVAFFAALSDVGTIVQRWMENGRDVLETGALDAARLLRYASRKANWRQVVLRALAQIVQNHQRPYGLRLRAVDALVQAAEPTAAILFRRLLSSDAASTRILSAIGLGGCAGVGLRARRVDGTRRSSWCGSRRVWVWWESAARRRWRLSVGAAQGRGRRTTGGGGGASPFIRMRLRHAARAPKSTIC